MLTAYFYAKKEENNLETEQTTAVQNDIETAENSQAVESTTQAETAQPNAVNQAEQKNSTETTTEAKNINSAKQEENAEQKVQGAPEKYETFTVPDGFNAPIEKFTEFAKSNNWTQEQAQSAVDFYVNEIAPQMQEQHQKTVAEWTKQSQQKFSKEDIDASIGALNKFATPELKQFLNDSGLGSYPEMIGLFKTIADKISDGSFIDANSAANTSGRLYKNSPDMYK